MLIKFTKDVLQMYIISDINILTLIILVEYCYAECPLCLVSFVLIVTNNTFMQSFIVPNVILMCVIMLIILGSKNYFEFSTGALKEENSNKNVCRI